MQHLKKQWNIHIKHQIFMHVVYYIKVNYQN